MRKSYPSDVSREEFEKIREALEGLQKKTHPRKYDLYDIFCAVLYLLKEDVHGEPYHMIILIGRMYVITMIYGRSQMMME